MASRSVKQQRTEVMGMSAPKPSITSSIRAAVASRKPQSTLQQTMNGNPVGQPRPFRTKPISTSQFNGNGTDTNGNRTGARRQVGEADPATRRKALDAALRPGPPVKSAPKPRPASQPPMDPSGAGGRARGRKIDELVDKMQ
jgi:hypothetical protein